MENGLKIVYRTDRDCRALFIPEEDLGPWLRRIRREDRLRQRRLVLGQSLVLGAAGVLAWFAAGLNLMAPGLAAGVSLLCLWGLGRNAVWMDREEV